MSDQELLRIVGAFAWLVGSYEGSYNEKPPKFVLDAYDLLISAQPKESDK